MVRMDSVAKNGQRGDVIESVADEIMHNYAHGRVIVAIDGVDGAGTTDFAADLVDVLKKRGHSAFHAKVDDFRTPRARRYQQGESSGAGRYIDSYDYSVLRRVLVDPFRMGGSTGFVAAAFDWRRDQPIQAKWLTAPEDAILVINGVFLQRPELRGLWNYTIWLDVPPKDAWARLVATDPLAHDETAWARSEAGQKLYLKEVRVREVASAIIDNTDPAHPMRVFADSC